MVDSASFVKSTPFRAFLDLFNTLQIFTSVNLFVFSKQGYQVSRTYSQVSLKLEKNEG